MDLIQLTTHIDARTVQLAAQELQEPASRESRDDVVARLRAQAGANPVVVLFDGDDVTEVELHDGQSLRIGRSVTADLQLEHPEVSRRHAMIERHGDVVRILDDRSLNGVFVNGEQIDQHRMSDTDEALIGAFAIRVVLPG